MELASDDHPVSLLAAQRADDDGRRRESLEQLRRLARDHRDEIDMFGYHDPTEFPPGEGDRPGAVASPTSRARSIPFSPREKVPPQGRD